MLPPRPNPKTKYQSIRTEQNMQCLLVKQLKQHHPIVSQKALTDALINIPRPLSSKPGRSFLSGLSSQKIVRQSSSIRSEDTSFQKQVEYEAAKRNPPALTSKCWAIYELGSQKLIYGVRTKKRIEVASLTKIMNLVSILELIKRYNLNPKQIKIAISQWAASMIGTSADLKKRDVITLQDLLYAMMLPSGNDAACQIAMIGGMILKLAETGRVAQIYQRQQVEMLLECRSNIVRYLSLMNKLSLEMGMKNTKWANPHGLSNKQNKTTVEDMCKLCGCAMRNKEIRKIVNTKVYSCNVTTYFTKDPEEGRVMTWENTNKMLWRGWNGIKTGVTPNAGPCLAASYSHVTGGREYQLLALITGCLTMNQRWEEVKLMVDWAIENQLY